MLLDTVKITESNRIDPTVNFRRNGARDFRRNGATEKYRNQGFERTSSMGGFSAFGNGVAGRWRQGFGTPITVAVEDEAIGAMPEPIEGGGPQEFVGGEGLAPLAEVEIAGEDGGGALVAFGHQIVEGFVLGWA